MSAQTGETPIVKEPKRALRDKTKRLFFFARNTRFRPIYCSGGDRRDRKYFRNWQFFIKISAKITFLCKKSLVCRLICGGKG